MPVNAPFPEDAPPPEAVALPDELAFTPSFPRAKHRRIGQLLVAGGVWSLVVGGAHTLVALVGMISGSGMATFNLLPACVALGAGAACLGRGIRLTQDRAWLEPPPFFPAALLMLNFAACDPIGFSIGAVVTVWLFDPEVRRFYNG